MNRKWLDLYAYLAPAVLTPLAFWLWWKTYQSQLAPVLMAWLIPILYAYIVPAVGTNVLKVWEFDTRLRLGRFRPHHGFVFGSATAMVGWCCHTGVASDLWAVLQRSLIYASVLGFWNILYEIRILKAGILRVYNQPWADGQGAEAVALDYAPWFFAGFGAIYGAGLGLAEWWENHYHLTAGHYVALFLAVLGLCVAIPVFGYRHCSFRNHGHSGCRPVMKEGR